MDNHNGNGLGMEGDTTRLAHEFTKRIRQLGLSRRQVSEISGLSRQTLHNIEHGNRVDLKPSTLSALDKAMQWRPGTTLALASGDESVLGDMDEYANRQRESAYRWTIVERIQRLSLDELERMVAMMESEALGEDSPMAMDDVIERVERNVMRRLEKRMGNTHNAGTGTT